MADKSVQDKCLRPCFVRTRCEVYAELVQLNAEGDYELVCVGPEDQIKQVYAEIFRRKWNREELLRVTEQNDQRVGNDHTSW
jgi:hypothetical protein